MASSRGAKKFDDSSTLSPRVYQLAQLVYKEFESLRRMHGEASFNTLIPLTLKVLEEMDQLSTEKRKLNLDLNLQLAEKNDVVFQLERANKLREVATQRIDLLEDELLTSKSEAEKRIDKLESTLRHHEMLSRNAREHATRLEERDAQLHAELTTAHERYTELLRAYMDQSERIKLSDADAQSIRTVANTRMEMGNHVTRESAGGAGAPLQTYRPDNDEMDEDGFYKPRCTTPTLPTDEIKASDRVASFIDLLNDDKNALNVVKNDLIRKLDDVTGEKLMLAKELEYHRVNRDQTRDEANHITRQLNESERRLAHLRARLKLYEDIDEGTESLVIGTGAVGNLQHAISYQLLPGPPITSSHLKSAAQFGGSLNQLGSSRMSESISVAVGTEEVDISRQPSTLEAGDASQMSASLASITKTMLTTKVADAVFTKREMARVIAERNHYKESLLELQDAVRQMELMRVRRYGERLYADGTQRTHSPIATRHQGVAHNFWSGLQSVADEVASGLHSFFNEIEPMFAPNGLPSEVQDVGFASPQHWRASSHSRPTATSGDVSASELRRMFSHLLGHAAGQGTEAVFGTGNDFAAAVASQSLTHSLSASNVADSDNDAVDWEPGMEFSLQPGPPSPQGEANNSITTTTITPPSPRSITPTPEKQSDLT